MSRTAIRHGITLFFPLALAACPSGAPPDDETGASTSTSSGSSSASTSGDRTTGEASTSGEPATTGSSTGVDASTGGEASTGDGSSSGEPASTGGDASTGDPGVCGDGVLDPGEQCDAGQETKLCDEDCTAAFCGDLHVNYAAGENCEDGNLDDSDDCLSDCTFPKCGDGILSGKEECDDGNKTSGDGCSSMCIKERWAHFGVAHDVPIDDLYLWEPCWSSTYEAGKLLDSVGEACTGDHLLVGCRKTGDSVLTLAAHAKRSVVLQPVNYDAKERSNGNGVDFYWSPYYSGVIGFGPENGAYCFVNGSDPSGMCWLVGANMPQKFTAGYRCGDDWKSLAPSAAWERVVFQAWD